MRKDIIVPAVALGGGAVGFALRRWELATAFEPPENGFRLAISGAPATLALIALSVAVAVALLVLMGRKHRAFLQGYDGAFTARGNTLCLVMTVLAAFLLLGSAVVNFLGLPAAYEHAEAEAAYTRANPMLSITPRALLGVLCVGSCAAMLLTARNSYRGGGKGTFSGALLVPAYTCCVWLIAAYQLRAGDPVRLSYAYELLAIIAILLALYFIAGFAFEKPKPFRAAVFSGLGIYLSLVTLADGHDLRETLLYGAFILYLTGSLAVLLANDARREPRQVRTRPEYTMDDATFELIETEEPSDE